MAIATGMDPFCPEVTRITHPGCCCCLFYSWPAIGLTVHCLAITSQAAPWPVPGSNTSERPEGEFLTFRGIKNFDATIDWAMKHGMDTAEEFVLTGGSAGGLSTFLHMDRVAARLKAEAPSCKKVTGAPVVGYFLDHGNFLNVTGTPDTPSFRNATYTTKMRYLTPLPPLLDHVFAGQTVAHTACLEHGAGARAALHGSHFLVLGFLKVEVSKLRHQDVCFL